VWLVGSPEIPHVTRHRAFDKMDLPPTRRLPNYLTTSENSTRIPDRVNKARPKFETLHRKALDSFDDFYVKFLISPSKLIIAGASYLTNLRTRYHLIYGPDD
jgi:hypothetical protein